MLEKKLKNQQKKKVGESMKEFAAGIILGTVAGVAAAMIVNPMDKKDMYRNCCKASRMVKKMNRSLNHALHNFM